MALLVKKLLANAGDAEREREVRSLGEEDPLE